MRHQKMAEWMENVEKAIARIMADKVYTSAEFKRERDNFHALCKDLERAEVKKWLAQILEILMAERAKDQKAKEGALLDALIKKHEELIPTVMKTQVMVDLLNKTRDSIMGLYNQIKHNVEVMGITLPDDKKKIISKEMAALEEKLVVVGQFEEKVKVIE